SQHETAVGRSRLSCLSRSGLFGALMRTGAQAHSRGDGERQTQSPDAGRCRDHRKPIHGNVAFLSMSLRNLAIRRAPRVTARRWTRVPDVTNPYPEMRPKKSKK